MKTKKIKEFLKKIKELWAIPRYRALIKLSLYGVMFLIIIIMANLYSGVQNNSEETDKSFSEILNSTNFNNTEINYNIKVNNIEYKIEGQIENNILIGYLESNNSIKKIKLDNNIIYNTGNNNEVVDDELNNIFIKEFLIPKKIIDLIDNESAYIEKSDSATSYTYEITHNNNQYEITLTTNLEVITNISAKNSDIQYNLTLIFDKIN